MQGFVRTTGGGVSAGTGFGLFELLATFVSKVCCIESSWVQLADRGGASLIPRAFDCLILVMMLLSRRI